MTKPVKTPYFKHLFLYKQGVKLYPSQNFLDKFREIYNELLFKAQNRQHCEPINEERAVFFIVSIVSCVIYCIDCGLDVWFRRILLFLQKESDYSHNSAKASEREDLETVRKLSIRPIKSARHRIFRFINRDNPEYMAYLEQKNERFNKVKEYYKELYGKQDEWWIYEKDE